MTETLTDVLGSAGVKDYEALKQVINDHNNAENAKLKLFWLEGHDFELRHGGGITESAISLLLAKPAYRTWKFCRKDLSGKVSDSGIPVHMRWIPPRNAHARGYNYGMKHQLGSGDHKKWLWEMRQGSGNGETTARIKKEMNPRSIVALEPRVERDNWIGSQQLLAKLDVEIHNLTLQQAVQKTKFQQAFDVVTVFKYNIHTLEQDAFIGALSKAVKANGLVIITSVEEDRCHRNRNLEPSLYIRDKLDKHFKTVTLEIQKDMHGDAREGIFFCSGPKTDMKQEWNQR